MWLSWICVWQGFGSKGGVYWHSSCKNLQEAPLAPSQSLASGQGQAEQHLHVNIFKRRKLLASSFALEVLVFWRGVGCKRHNHAETEVSKEGKGHTQTLC